MSVGESSKKEGGREKRRKSKTYLGINLDQCFK